jgi:hypothetical protein
MGERQRDRAQGYGQIQAGKFPGIILVRLSWTADRLLMQSNARNASQITVSAANGDETDVCTPHNRKGPVADRTVRMTTAVSATHKRRRRMSQFNLPGERM